ncbi:MAG: IgGFc-binding protein [Nevskia sp.]|nr:IgGFc-binding protein [Nevskia sp.]
MRHAAFLFYRVAALLCAALAAAPAHAGNGTPSGGTSSGTEFWVGFTPSFGVTPMLFLTGSFATTGTVSVAGIGYSSAFTITPGTATTITLPTGAVVNNNETVENLGVHITANAAISAYGLDYEPAGTDGYLGLPVTADGTDYLVLAYNSYPPGLEGTYRSQYLIVATQDNTAVSITPSPLDVGCSPVSLMLNTGQTWRHRACGAVDEDVTGTHISASAPIAVFGGHECTNIPNSTYTYCNQIVEQMTPTTAWGRNFLTVPFAGRTGGDQFRVLALNGNTQVSVNGSLSATLAAGTFYQTLLATPSTITSNQPVLVAQYSNSASFDNNQYNADSSEMLVPPQEQYLAAYTVSTPDSATTDITVNFINVIAPTSALAGTLLDGKPIPATDFSAIGSTGFSAAQEAVSVGSHTLSAPLPLGIFSYGYGSFDNYSYTGGFSVSPVALVTTVTLSPKSAAQQVGQQQCLSAAVGDQNGKPLASIRVDFTITGANPTTGFATTDTTGNASFCYTGANAGSDSVTATVGDKSDTATVTWTSVTVTMAFTPGPGGGAAAPPGTIYLGGSAVLNWSTTHATACTAGGSWSGTRPTQGSLSVSPASLGSYTYTLNCTGTIGSGTASATLTVAPQPAPVAALSVTPASVAVGQSATLSWSSSYATSCTASGPGTSSAGTSGLVAVVAQAVGTQSYTLSCTGPGGTSTRAAALAVTAGGDASGTGGGGGGSFAPGMLVLLAGLARWRRRC